MAFLEQLMLMLMLIVHALSSFTTLGVTCQMSHVTCKKTHKKIIMYRVVELDIGVSVINRAYPV